MRAALLACLSALSLSACVVNNPSYVPSPPNAAPPTLQVTFNDVHAASVGSASLWETANGVYMRLGVAGALGAGWHAIHFHEHGACSGANFADAGAHLGHVAGHHGLLNPQGPEPGDMPNFLAPPFDQPGAELFSPYVTLGAAAQNGRAPLRDADGSAIVIHLNPDDQITQPIGGAGERIACAIIPPA